MYVPAQLNGTLQARGAATRLAREVAFICKNTQVKSGKAHRQPFMTSDAIASCVLGVPGPGHLLPGCLQHIEECITVQQLEDSC